MKISIVILTASLFLSIACGEQRTYDVILKNGLVYDGNGGEPYVTDIGINNDTIGFIGDLKNASAKNKIEVNGMCVAPGLINMLSWANASLIVDGRSQSDIKQGVTLEIMGEGSSMGPLNAALKNQRQQALTDIKYTIEWTTLGEYLSYLERKGVSCNIASFVGATTIRMHVIGEDDRAPSDPELDSMKLLVRQAMEEGALGVSSSLIYPPAFFATTEELIALSQEVARYGGSYISHMRSEGTKLYEALEELITIAQKANIHAEVYHLKAAGKTNWYKMDSVIRRIERARKEGINITANMYTYIAGSTGLTATMPPSLQAGGFGMLHKRLKDPEVRRQLITEMNTNTDKWENFYAACGSPEKILLVGFKQDSLKKFIGKNLAEIARLRSKSPEETAMDLILQDSTRVQTVYFMMDETNIKKQLVLPWVSFGSDEGSYSPEGVFIKSNCHPRAYGNFARLLGKYVRDEKLMPMQEAIRKLTKLPATNFKIQKRGELKVGNYADIIIFDAAAIHDHATFERPHQFASGMMHVFVNGVQVLKNGTHTGAKPGKFVKGPGYKVRSHE